MCVCGWVGGCGGCGCGCGCYQYVPEYCERASHLHPLDSVYVCTLESGATRDLHSEEWGYQGLTQREETQLPHNFSTVYILHTSCTLRLPTHYNYVFTTIFCRSTDTNVYIKVLTAAPRALLSSRHIPRSLYPVEYSRGYFN